MSDIASVMGNLLTRPAYALALAGILVASTVYVFPAQRAFAHNFSGDESASFIALVESIRVEIGLVESNLGSNMTLAEKHAVHANGHLDEHIIEEISERNQRLGSDLPAALEDLHDSVGNSTSEQVQAKVQNINDLLSETVTVRIDSEQLTNSTVWGLIFANMADGVLEHYNAAYGVKTEDGGHGHGDEHGEEHEGIMTHDEEGNMTHDEGSMEMEETETSSMSHDEMEGGSMEDHGNMSMSEGNKTLVDMTHYQSAHAMAIRMQELYNEQGKSFVPANSTELTVELEEGFAHLIEAIENKEQLDSVTVIVHTQVHANLQKVYNLQVIPEFPLPLLMIIPAIAGIIAATRLGALRRK